MAALLPAREGPSGRPLDMKHHRVGGDMPQTAIPASPGTSILADLVANGGGTYDRETLEPFSPTTGYAIGVGGITLPFENLTPEQIAWAIGKVAGEYSSKFVGTWLNDGTVYIDAVTYNTDARSAYLQAVARGQRAVFDFAAQSELRVQQMEFDQ